MIGLFRTIINKLSDDKYYFKFLPLIFSFISGFSIFYFLYIFNAYGIQKGLSYSGHSLLFRCISFGLLTFTYLTIFEIILKPKLSVTGFGYSFIWYAGLIFLGSQLIFILFNFFWNWQELNMESYLLIIIEFPLMMIFPLFFYLGLKSIIKSRSQEENYLLFQSENGKDNLKIRKRDFLYAESLGNYISVVFLTKNKSNKHLIRKRLKVLELELKTIPEIERSHRSYLVNRLNIRSIKQSKAKLHVEIGSAIIPISKQYKDSFLS
ncbi:LytTr DNA-binding domain-containing protein [Lutibacter agarilyticus]|uniref:LytTr DNA-binding domain-containing protein n=1 Tax=Lutibacter agarilyticus TaxID=1109740 RepID=A0A238VE76_9FLAO|nr:LytTR family DNA-binding domain-containing protein [Lutibacter agarilyticus]SNR32347.1 LytTr DNA-binding domain-containing protein [Lutibacter agarilyticus]